MKHIFSLLLLSLAISTLSMAQGPKILIVTAHPDDETGVAAVVYKVTHDLHGTVDQCVITNGEGGYKYSTLGNDYYGIDLTDPATGRANLPRIRKQELINAGKVIGTNNIFFLDQLDSHYGLDEHDPLDTSWNVQWVSTRLHDIMARTKYDFVFCLLPTTETHGGHKAATLLALRAVRDLPVSQRPIILGASVASKGDTAYKFTQLKNYSETHTDADTAMYKFDMSVPFGYRGALNYKIIVNWEIAEHKSQGTMQLAMNRGDYEIFWYFSINGPAGNAKCEAFFESLKKINYKVPAY